MNANFQMGLLHFVHLLVSADGHTDDREKAALAALQAEEKISPATVADFEKSVAGVRESEIYTRGVDYLKKCTDEEKLTALVHLYRLAESDAAIHIKEVRLLLYAINVTNVEFDDVVMSVQMAKAGKMAS
jgi:uncharacterized tellurite resistance protein B-like protein